MSHLSQVEAVLKLWITTSMEVRFFSHDLFSDLPPRERAKYEAIAKRLSVREGRPFFVGDDGFPIEDLDAFCKYLVDPQRPSINTWKTYAYQLNVFFRWLDVQGKHWTEVVREDLDTYHMVRTSTEFQTGNAIQGQSWNIAKTALVHFYEYAKSRSLIANLPFEYRNQKAYIGGKIVQVADISAKKTTDKHINFIAIPNYKGVWRPLLSKRRNIQRNLSMVDLLIASGLRISEALNLKTHQIPDPDAFAYKGLKTVTIMVKGKGGKKRKVRIPKRILRDIRFYIDEDRKEIVSQSSSADPGFVFLSTTGNRVSERTIQELFSAISLECGVRLTPHGCRHTFAVYQLDTMIKKMVLNLKKLREQGTDSYHQMLNDPLAQLQKMLGHSSILTTYIYLDFLEDSEALVDESLDEWTDWNNENGR